MGKTVLVVDDDKDVRAMLKLTLEQLGCDVRTAGDGREAIDLIDRKRPDLVVLDLKMPRMNGYQLFAQLKSNDQTSRIPVIVITGLTQDSDRDDAEWQTRMKADGFLTKPFTIDELASRIQEIATKFL